MQLVDFDHLLGDALTTCVAEKILNRYLLGFGFKYYAFTYYQQSIRVNVKPIYDFASISLRPWHEYYLDQFYADTDRTLAKAALMTRPVYWDVKQQHHSAKNIRELKIRLESSEYGIRQGLSIPVHGGHGEFASLTLHQYQGETTLSNWQLDQYEWMTAANLYWHHIKRILTQQKATKKHPKLTRRERQCLELTNKLWRIEQISLELGIKPRTVNYHLHNANKKLGVNNKYQAAQLYLNLSAI